MGLIQESRAAAMPDQLTKLAYQTIQQGKGLFGLAHTAVSTRLIRPPVSGVSPTPVPVTHELSKGLVADVNDPHVPDI